jgi:hypothetical protein
LGIALAAGIPAHANLIITPAYDATITSDPSAGAIVSTINQAISTYQSLIANNVSVKIYFQEGGGLGTSETLLYNRNVRHRRERVRWHHQPERGDHFPASGNQFQHLQFAQHYRA